MRPEICGKRYARALDELKEEYEIIGDVRKKGLMIGIELVKDREKKTPAKEETGRIRDLARERGLLIGSSEVKDCVLRIQPPLVIRREQIDVALVILEEVIRETKLH